MRRLPAGAVARSATRRRAVTTVGERGYGWRARRFVSRAPYLALGDRRRLRTSQGCDVAVFASTKLKAPRFCASAVPRRWRCIWSPHGHAGVKTIRLHFEEPQRPGRVLRRVDFQSCGTAAGAQRWSLIAHCQAPAMEDARLHRVRRRRSRCPVRTVLENRIRSRVCATTLPPKCSTQRRHAAPITASLTPDKLPASTSTSATTLSEQTKGRFAILAKHAFKRSRLATVGAGGRLSIACRAGTGIDAPCTA